MSRLLERLKEEILVLDGAMGTQLYKKGLEVGDCPEELNLTHPQIIEEIHREYVEAGSDIIQTNTFGASRIKLNEYELGDKIEEINKKAVELARRAAKKDTIVSASIGPTGKLLEPMGDLPFSDALEIFGEQAKILEEAGADAISIETMTDLQEARAALIGIKEYTSLPIICHLTYEQNLKTMTGTDPLTAITVLEGLGADVIGANCSMGPEGLLKVINKMGGDTDTYLCVQPNAGLPILDENNNTVFPMEAKEMAGYIDSFIESGANIIGGCCGSTPEYISLVKEKVKGIKPKKRERRKETQLASRSKRISIADHLPTRIIGERINPTGRKELSAQLKEGEMEILAKEALKQSEAGADILDVNIGVPKIDQVATMGLALEKVQNLVDLPISIDTTNGEVLEAALQKVVGKPLVNSVTGEKESLERVLPLVKKYGAAVLGLTLDDNGIPKTAQGRLEVARKIVKRAEDLGIKRENILIDTLVLTASAQQERVTHTLEALRLIKEELGVATVLGVSNISFGLPHREKINTSFLAMAIQSGLNAPIMDPTIVTMKDTVLTSDLLLNKDPGSKRYLEVYGNNEESKKSKAEAKKEEKDKNILERIQDDILKGSKETIIDKIEEGLKEYSAFDIINKGLIPGIKSVGEKYDKGIYFLPQLMLGAEAMQKAFGILKPILKEEGDEGNLAKIVIATVKGDIHDIGKNIVKVMLENNGFEIIDLGKDVPNEKIISTALDKKADIICLSALMTTTMPRMEEIVTQLKEANSTIPVMVGGAVVTEDYAQNIGAHYSANAVGAVKVARKLAGN
ncbi:homocysteine S-methyltransferase family protein [Halonatronum saccharophilum]|uniref:homocysteine S-methyltransferase family protein n=1 Tax=Halonatronum saccharophilum TaxID=150060 RepID=UPI0004803B2C|nr:homocysteine S-methyltransferase family protein [Halonatronum saccharophilum]